MFGIKIAGRNINNLSYADDTILMADSEEPLDEGERGEWKSWLKTQHSKTNIMASNPITSWQTDGKTMKTVTDFIFLGSKITAYGDCSHEIKRRLLHDQPGQHIKKQRHYFADKGLYSQSYGVSSSYVWMWEADPKKDWALKHCFQIVVLEKTLGLQEAQTSPS